MQTLYLVIFTLVLAYFTGSLPTSIWVGRIFFHIDIREHGSGNAGATNTMRILGVGTGIPVLLFDIFKGWLAVKYAFLFKVYPPDSISFMNLSIALGVVAVLGHIFPVYANFRGGKGVATIFGVLLALSPFATLCAAGIFLAVLLISKYVSLSSIIAGMSFPVWIIWVFNSGFLSLKVFALIVSVLLIFTHRKNIDRLLKGKESHADFLFKKKAHGR